MDEIISEYRKLLELLDEEKESIVRSMQGELMEIYREILQKERENVEKNIHMLYQYY